MFLSFPLTILAFDPEGYFVDAFYPKAFMAIATKHDAIWETGRYIEMGKIEIRIARYDLLYEVSSFSAEVSVIVCMGLVPLGCWANNFQPSNVK